MFEFDFDLRDTNKPSTQLDSSADDETKTTESTDGRGGSISLEEETTRIALLLGSISKSEEFMFVSAQITNWCSFCMCVHVCVCVIFHCPVIFQHSCSCGGTCQEV